MLILDDRLSIVDNKKDYHNKWEGTVVKSKNDSNLYLLGPLLEYPFYKVVNLSKSKPQESAACSEDLYKFEVVPVGIKGISYVYLNKSIVIAVTRALAYPYKRSFHIDNIGIQFSYINQGSSIREVDSLSYGIPAYIIDKLHNYGKESLAKKILFNNPPISFETINRKLENKETFEILVLNKFLCMTKHKDRVRLYSGGILVYDSYKKKKRLTIKDPVEIILENIIKWKELSELS